MRRAPAASPPDRTPAIELAAAAGPSPQRAVVVAATEWAGPRLASEVVASSSPRKAVVAAATEWAGPRLASGVVVAVAEGAVDVAEARRAAPEWATSCGVVGQVLRAGSKLLLAAPALVRRVGRAPVRVCASPRPRGPGEHVSWGRAPGRGPLPRISLALVSHPPALCRGCPAVHVDVALVSRPPASCRGPLATAPPFCFEHIGFRRRGKGQGGHRNAHRSCSHLRPSQPPPTFILTLIIFTIIGFNLNVDGNPNLTDKLDAIENAFNVTPLLMFVPGVVIFLIYRKTPALVALFIGVIVAGVASIFFQPNIIVEISNSNILNFNSAYKGVMQSITVDTSIETASSELNDLLSSGGMKGMLGTVWLIICAMVFGGVMESIGALTIISKSILKLAKSTFGLFTSTVASG